MNNYKEIEYQGYTIHAYPDGSCTANTFPLAHCKTAVPDYGPTLGDILGCKKEGTTPMRYNDNYASASASVQSQPSDYSVTRDYLLKRLASADYPKDQELRELYNLYVDNTPKTYAEMIAIIKAGTYTIDPKVAKKIEAEDFEDDDFHWGPMHGIVWPGPVQDYPGFEAALQLKVKQYTAAKDVIMTGTSTEALAAIQAFEAWLPTVAVTTAPAA